MPRLITRIAVFLMTMAGSSANAAEDPAVLLPEAARLGMDRAAIRALDPPPMSVEPPLVFGPLSAEFVDQRFGGLGHDGRLYYQVDPTSGRLRQALFEWRDGEAARARVADVLGRLEVRLGAPTFACVQSGNGRTVPGQPEWLVAARWDGATTVLWVSVLDHRSNGVALFDLNSDADPRRPSHERRRVTRRSLPRRLIARLVGADDVALTVRRDCPAGTRSRDR